MRPLLLALAFFAWMLDAQTIASPLQEASVRRELAQALPVEANIQIAQPFDGAIDRHLPMFRYHCDGHPCFIVPKPQNYAPSLQPIRRRDYWYQPDWKHPPAHCYGQRHDPPECRGEFG